jgi:hypothetical protein
VGTGARRLAVSSEEIRSGEEDAARKSEAADTHAEVPVFAPPDHLLALR